MSSRPFSLLLPLCFVSALALNAYAALDPTGVYQDYLEKLDAATPPVAAMATAAADGVYPWSEPKASEPPPVPDPAPLPDPEPEPEPEEPVSPFTTVDASYFDDALFIGDSLTRGFQEYSSGIPNAKYAAYLGAGPKQFMEGLVENISGQQVAAIDEILAAAPKKVYILLGTNSMATLTDEAFLKYYNDFLDFLLPQLPQDTVYYIQGIPPVSAEKMAGDENFSVERIRGLNESLAKIAYDRDLHYLDLFSALADENGALRADIASGSIHLNNEGYNVWREFLVTHTAYSKENPYLPGSPYYTAPAA